MTPTGVWTIEARGKGKTVMFLKMQGLGLWDNSVCLVGQGDLSLLENVPECLLDSLALS